MINGKSVLDAINKEIWLPIKAIFSANRDYPYHDYHSATTKVTYQGYSVGENNIGKDGTQAKLFVSKSTLILATTNTYIKLNSSNNVVQTLLANNYYTFKSNVRQIFYAYVQEEGTIYIHVEGVLPDEARSEHF